MKFKKIICLIVCLSFLFSSVVFVNAQITPINKKPDNELTKGVDNNNQNPLNVKAKSAILIDGKTSKVLYEYNSNEELELASVTKIMTLLLVFESLEQGKFSLDDMVTASAHACSMGGSQIWLEPNEQMSVNDLIKAAAISSANDAAVALAELVAGSEEIFVNLMNRRAIELGMLNTNFVNATGLDAQGHHSTAYDIALMSKELLKHKDVAKYTTVWMDSLRNGKTSLVNTNKMLKSYNGITGLKTGTTSNAGSCLSASATRGDMDLIAVVMGCETSKDRFEDAKILLDYGFNSFNFIKPEIDEKEIKSVKIYKGDQDFVKPIYNEFQGIIVPKGREKDVKVNLNMVLDVVAPVEKSQILGDITITLDDKVLEKINITAENQVNKITLGKAFKKLVYKFFSN